MDTVWCFSEVLCYQPMCCAAEGCRSERILVVVPADYVRALSCDAFNACSNICMYCVCADLHLAPHADTWQVRKHLLNPKKVIAAATTPLVFLSTYTKSLLWFDFLSFVYIRHV